MSLPSAPLAALLACMLSLCLPQPAAAQAEIRIGVLDFLGAEATVDEWSPLLHHLERSLPGHPLSLLQLDHARMRAAVIAGELDFVITNPGHYVELEAELGASRILTLDGGGGRSPERALGSAVIVRAERAELGTLKDLRGQRVAIVGREGFGGFQLFESILCSLREGRHAVVASGD